jgi:uncharacterized protein (DUF2141 family)
VIALAAPLLLGARPATTALEMEFVNLRSAKGVLQICLTADPADFPDCRNAAHAIRRTIPAAVPRLRLEGLPPGDYAIAVIHDANSNARLDTTLGIPREGFGFSRNPAIRFGPPRFSAARFPLGTGAEKQQVRIRYLF